MESNRVRTLTDMDFDQVTGKGLSLVDFWAPWCYPCRIQGPILEKVAGKVGDGVQIFKLNVDENQEVAGRHGITGIPTLLLFKDGEVVNEFVGVQAEDVLISALESHM
jgi:thioredoxin 1